MIPNAVQLSRGFSGTVSSCIPPEFLCFSDSLWDLFLWLLMSCGEHGGSRSVGFHAVRIEESPISLGLSSPLPSPFCRIFRERFCLLHRPGLLILVSASCFASFSPFVPTVWLLLSHFVGLVPLYCNVGGLFLSGLFCQIHF